MKLAAFLIPLVLAAAPLHAADKAPADRLLDIMKFESSALAAAKTSFKPTLDQFKKQGLPEAGLKEISAAADELFTKTFSSPELHAQIVKLYESKFTNAELEELIKFYNSPVGHKSIETMPAIMSEAGQLGQTSVQKDIPAFQEKLVDIMAKYQKDMPAPKAADKEEEEDK